MIFAVRDGQKWGGPGTAHPCSIPHWRLGGIPQGNSKGNKHPSSHSRSHPRPLRSHRQEQQQELSSEWNRVFYTSGFLLSSHCSNKKVSIACLLLKPSYFALHEGNKPTWRAFTVMQNWVWQNSQSFFSAPSQLQFLQTTPLPISMNEVSQVSAVCSF